MTQGSAGDVVVPDADGAGRRVRPRRAARPRRVPQRGGCDPGAARALEPLRAAPRRALLRRRGPPPAVGLPGPAAVDAAGRCCRRPGRSRVAARPASRPGADRRRRRAAHGGPRARARRQPVGAQLLAAVVTASGAGRARDRPPALDRDPRPALLDPRRAARRRASCSRTTGRGLAAGRPGARRGPGEQAPGRRSSAAGLVGGDRAHSVAAAPPALAVGLGRRRGRASCCGCPTWSGRPTHGWPQLELAGDIRDEYRTPGGTAQLVAVPGPADQPARRRARLPSASAPRCAGPEWAFFRPVPIAYLRAARRVRRSPAARTTTCSACCPRSPRPARSWSPSTSVRRRACAGATSGSPSLRCSRCRRCSRCCRRRRWTHRSGRR